MHTFHTNSSNLLEEPVPEVCHYLILVTILGVHSYRGLLSAQTRTFSLSDFTHQVDIYNGR
jgi:hypothetical protein